VVENERPSEQKNRLPSWMGTRGILVICIALKACTNIPLTWLHGESNSLAFAGRPAVSALQPFFPPAGDRELDRLKPKPSGIAGLVFRMLGEYRAAPAIRRWHGSSDSRKALRCSFS